MRVYNLRISKRERIKILVSEPHIQSIASLILLKNHYQRVSGERIKGEWRLWLTFRNRYLRRQAKKYGGLTCYLCGKSNLTANVNSQHANGREATVDHKHPTSRGGRKYDEENLGVACLECNNKKADKILE